MRKKLIKIILVAATLMVFGCMDVKAEAPKDANANKQEWEVLAIVNKERTAGSKEGLSTFSSLQSAAGIRAKELIELFSHDRPDGTKCFTVLEEKNIKRYSAGENIAAGQQSPEQVMTAWMNSPGHKSNIMSEQMDFNHMGVGYVTGGDYGKNWVQLFVGGCTIESIKVNGVSDSGYAKGTKIDDMDIYVEATCDMHGTSYMPLSGSMCTGYKANETGVQKVNVTYHDKTTTFDVNVKNADNTQKIEDADDIKKEDEKSNNTTVKEKKPATVKSLRIKKISSAKIKLSWKKVSATGYEIYMKTGNGKYKKTKTIKKANTTSVVITKLKKKKKYFFKVRAYRKTSSGKNYGKYSSVKSIKM